MLKSLLKNKYRSQTLLLLILLFALIIRILFFTGIGPSDSLTYAQSAYNLASGEMNLIENHMMLRLGMLLPTSLLYSYFGVNEISSNILPLLFSLGSIVLIYLLGRLLFNEKIGLLSAFLLSFFPADVVYATRLMTDIPAAFFITLSVYLFFKSEKTGKRLNSSLYYFFSGISIGVAYLMKELALLIVLFFIIYFLYNKKIKREHLLLILGLIFVISFEFLFFLKLTGNPFLRYHTIDTSTSNIIIQTNMYGRGSFPFSLLHIPYILFTDQLQGLFYSFIFIAIFYCIANKKRETYALLFWFIPLLLYLAMGSVSLTKYVPIPANPRYLAIIITPGILLLSFFLSQEQPLIKRILMPSIVILLFATSIGYVYISEQRSYLDSIKNSYDYLKLLPKKTIYTDERSHNIFDYFSGYKNNYNFKSFNYYEFLKPEETYALDLSQIKDSYVVINWKIINFLDSSYGNIKFPDQIYNIPQDWILEKEIGKNRVDKIEIYYVP
jgi:4-amino-4-deoxy-L-arabinose transferase-like glycosyltransferase